MWIKQAQWLFWECVSWRDNTLAREFSLALQFPSIFCDCFSTLEPKDEGNRNLRLASCILFLQFFQLTHFLRQLSLHLTLDQFWTPHSEFWY